MKNFNRDGAFSMSIKDPENTSDDSKIIESIVIGDELYIFKTQNIFRMLTAESIDPERNELDTKHSYEKISDFGTESEYVARCILQAKKLLPFITSGEESKNKVLEQLWELNLQLLNETKPDRHIWNGLKRTGMFVYQGKHFVSVLLSVLVFLNMPVLFSTSRKVESI